MRPILITGGNGTLGRAFSRGCKDRGLAHRLTSRAELDIASRASVEGVLAREQPWLVINAAGYVRVDDAEGETEQCHRDNVVGPETLARECRERGISLVSFSSDLVFDGRKAAPYQEHDRPAPLGVYGRTKLEAERRVLAAHPCSLVIRTSAFFGPWDRANFVTSTLRELAHGRSVRAANDTIISPTYVPDLVHACLDLGIDGEAGVWHLANVGSMTWFELARAAARLGRYPEEQVVGVPSSDLALRAPRPAFSVLGSSRGTLLPRVEDALRRYYELARQEDR